MNFFKSTLITLALGLSLGSAYAQEQKAATLDQLLQTIRADKEKDAATNAEREAQFLKDKNNQAALLKQAKDNLARERARSDALKLSYDGNEKALGEMEDKLKVTMGTLGELFGVVRQVAGDSKGLFESSMITAQFPERVAFVDELSRRKELPSAPEIERLWFELFTEMTESGKVTKFNAKVTSAQGVEAERTVFRVGTFNLYADGQFLNYLGDVNKIAELSRQPAGRFLSQVDDFQSAQPGELTALGVDPSRGAILSLLVQAPSFMERFHQGGLIGYVTMALAAIGLLIFLERYLVLSRLGRRISDQLKTDRVDPNNPLGKIFSVFQANKNKDIETLELKLDEAIIRETASIERGINTIKLFAAVGPLLGLLGTVTGMIETFQSITLFGTGDPKLMAGGISQALVTTVQGLVAAIPLILLHSVVNGKAKGIISVLDEQSVGLMAARAEQESRA
jgi:biopolymer transport protein ExbB